MNIAFSTLCLIIFILPGYFLRHVYLISGNWALNGTDSIRTSAGGPNNPFAFEALIILFISIVIHSVVILYPPLRSGYLHALYLLQSNNPVVENINLQFFLWFFIILCLISGVLGWLFYIVVRYFKWDIKYKYLRFKFYWFYILSGECVAFPENNTKRIPEETNQEIPAGTYVAATIEQNGKSYLYHGVLGDYVVKKSGELKTIFIKEAARRELNNDAQTDVIMNNGKTESKKNLTEKRFYTIQGDWLALRYKDIKSLNIKYFYLEPKS